MNKYGFQTNENFFYFVSPVFPASFQICSNVPPPVLCSGNGPVINRNRARAVSLDSVQCLITDATCYSCYSLRSTRCYCYS